MKAMRTQVFTGLCTCGDFNTFKSVLTVTMICKQAKRILNFVGEIRRKMATLLVLEAVLHFVQK